MTKGSELLSIYEVLDWSSYVELANSLIKFRGDQIDYELESMALKFSHMNGLLVYAKRKVDEAERELEAHVVMVRSEVTKLREKEGQRATDKYLDAYVKNTQDYVDLNKKYLDTLYKHNLLKALVQALDTKSSALIQLSANQRAENQILHK